MIIKHTMMILKCLNGFSKFQFIVDGDWKRVGWGLVRSFLFYFSNNNYDNIFLYLRTFVFAVPKSYFSFLCLLKVSF